MVLNFHVSFSSKRVFFLATNSYKYHGINHLFFGLTNSFNFVPSNWLKIDLFAFSDCIPATNDLVRGQCPNPVYCRGYRQIVFALNPQRGQYGLISVHDIDESVLLQFYISPHVYFYHVLRIRCLRRSHFVPAFHCFKDLRNLVFVTVKTALENRQISVDHEDVPDQHGTLQTQFTTFYLTLFPTATGTFILPSGRTLYQFGVTVCFKGR